MKTKAFCIVVCAALGAGAQAQLISPTGLIVINQLTGAGTITDENDGGGVGYGANDWQSNFYYSGTYMNPRVDETATTAKGLGWKFTTNAEPVELTQISIIIASGRTVNSGGPLGGTDPFSSTSVFVAVDEVLPGGVLVPTGYGLGLGGALSGNGIFDYSGQSALSNLTYILRPHTNYALVTEIDTLMTFSNTANVPSMGVTQEFLTSGSPNVQTSMNFQGAPEPSSYLAIGGGLLGFGLLRRKRK